MADAQVNFAGQVYPPRTVELCAAMSTIDAEAAALCEGLGEAQLSFATRPGRWSIAENLAHLRMTTAVFLPVVDLALELSRQRTPRSRPFALGIYGRMLVWQMEGPFRVKLRAPRAIQPQLLASPALELDHFLLSQSAMRKRMQSAEGLSLTAVRFPSPVARYIRLNLLECFHLLNAHSRLHLRQIRRVRRTLLG